MGERARIFALILIMASACLIVAGITIFLLYNTALEGQRARLVETAQSQARLIEAIARHDEIYERNTPGGPEAATMAQIVDAHENYRGFGETGEFTLAKREGNNIVYLLSHRHQDLAQLEAIPFHSKLAEPMRQALSGLSGTIIGLDYRGAVVLAAYEPVAVLDLGIVAKIDMTEVRAPFVRAGLIDGGAAIAVILLGTLLFLRISNPMIRTLQESEQNFRNSLDSSPLGVRIADNKGKLLYVNRALLRMYGYDSFEELESVPLEEQATSKTYTALLERLEKRKRGDHIEVDFESDIVRKDGEIRQVAVARSEVIWNGVQEYQVVYQDITERKRIEQELEQYSGHLEEMVKERTKELEESQERLITAGRLATLGQVSGSISHELRNPLAVIDSSVYYLKEKLKDADEKVLLHFERIQSGVTSAIAIIESLLNLTRIRKPQLEKVDLVAVTHNAIDNSRIPPGVKVVWNLPEEKVPVITDWEQLRIALRNIIKNALEAMDGKGTLTVAVESAIEGHAEVSFADTGQGIAEEDLERVFEPLFTTKATGIGFGLSITKMIITEHGGIIAAKSEPGKGATIALRLPLYNETSEEE